MIELVESAIIDYQHFFQALLEAVPWPMLILDRSLSVHYNNQAAVKLLEAEEPLQGKKLDQLVPGIAILQLVQKSIEAETVTEGEFTRGNLGTAWKISVTPLEHNPHNIQKAQQHSALKVRYHYFALVIEDLTELRRLERVRRDFIANISHELRTPLTSVRLLVETLEEAIDTDPEQAQTFVAKIETEVQHLNALVAEILELSRIESGQ